MLFIVWGALVGWFRVFGELAGRVLPWLVEVNEWPNWLIVILVVSIVALLLLRWRKSNRMNPDKGAISSPRSMYQEVWGVLWGWPPPPGKLVRDGPLCPDHMLPLQVEKRDQFRGPDKFNFHCPGPEGEEGHDFDGPTVPELAGRQDAWRDVNIYRDVNARLKAKDLRAQSQ